MKNIDYNRVCELEKIRVSERFLPYTVGAPDNAVRSFEQYKRANFIFALQFFYFSKNVL